MVILYEDNHLLAVDKPHRQAIQGDESGNLSLLDEIKAFIKERDQKPGRVFVGLLHRLDRPVAGVVLFAKTSKAASRLSEQFRTRTIKKVYRARLTSIPAEAGDGKIHKVEHWLLKNLNKNIVSVVREGTPGAQLAELDYKVIDESKFLVEVYPKTGRPHQIRVAFSCLGCPILGDVKYGAPKSKKTGSLALLAYSLCFNHPIFKEKICVMTRQDLFDF